KLERRRLALRYGLILHSQQYQCHREGRHHQPDRVCHDVYLPAHFFPSGPNCLMFSQSSVASLSLLVIERVIFVPCPLLLGFAMNSLNVASLQTMPAFFMASL